MNTHRAAVGLVSALSLAGSSFAQSWFPIGATWQHEYFNWSFLGYTRMVADGDTLLGGEQARVLRREIIAAFIEPPHQVQAFSRSPFAVTESQGLVRIWVASQSAYDTLWNMNAVPGDQWQMAPMTAPIVCDPESYTEVVDTGHVSIDGVQLRWLAVDNHFVWSGPELGVQRDTIIERIGPTLHYFTPHDLCNGQVDGADGLALRCYTDAEISYNRTAPWSCETLLGITDAETRASTGLFIAGAGACRVQLPGTNASARLELFDATGRVVRQLAVQNGDVVPVRAKGLVIYRFTDNTGSPLGTGSLVMD